MPPLRLHGVVAGPTDDVVRGNWASDLWGRYPYRWFDGENWSALVFDGTTQYLDPFVTSIRPETPASSSTPASAPASMPIVSPVPTPAPVDALSLSPRVLGAPTVGSTAELRPGPRGVAVATTAAGQVGVATRTTGGSSSGGASSEKKRPIWVPVVGVLMVIGFSWWLYNLRGGDDEFASSTDTAADASDALFDASSVTTTVAPSTTLAIPSTTAEVASLPPPVAPDATATGLHDCIEFVPQAAYVQTPWAQELWVAAGSDAAGLLAFCAALPPEQLTEIALRRDERELATTGSTSPAPTTVAPPADSIVVGTNGPLPWRP